MYLFCPSCHSTNIKKNGHTHYGKQNHQCRCCRRQFVRNNGHTVSAWTRAAIKKALKERLSLRAVCRVFGVSLNWLQSFAPAFWEQTPACLGLSPLRVERIKKLQVFGIQADELWSFVQKKVNKRWVWVACDPLHRLVVAYPIGGRGVGAARKFWAKIPPALKGCDFETDDWEAYRRIIPAPQHKVGNPDSYRD